MFVSNKLQLQILCSYSYFGNYWCFIISTIICYYFCCSYAKKTENRIQHHMVKCAKPQYPQYIFAGPIWILCTLCVYTCLCMCVRVSSRKPGCCRRTQSVDCTAGAGLRGCPDASHLGGRRIHCACLPPLKC